MNKAEKFIFIFLLLSAFTIWILIGWSFYTETWQTPLGPKLALPSPKLPPTKLKNIISPTHISQPLIFSISSNVPTLENKPQNAPTPQCNGPKTLTVLAIGSDTRASSYLYGLADVIRYIRIDFVTPRISVLEFPRDLWVEIPEISDHYDITHGKLNQAYLYGNPGMGYYNGPDQGPGLLARTLYLNFGARADNYISANMHTFVRLVDAIGGIDVDLPFSVDARKPDQQKRKDLYFAPGTHHLNGEQALMLGRIREYSVFARADQQNRIMCALRDAVMTPYILPKIPEIIDSFKGSVQTDLSLEQINQIACLGTKLHHNDIIFTTFPRELLTEDRTYDIGVKKEVYIFRAELEKIKLLVKEFDLGTWPEPLIPTGKQITETPRPRGEGQFTCP